jgi:hypothetical protein
VIGDWRKLNNEKLQFNGTHPEPTKSMHKDGALQLTSSPGLSPNLVPSTPNASRSGMFAKTIYLFISYP